MKLEYSKPTSLCIIQGAWTKRSGDADLSPPPILKGKVKEL